MQRGSIIGWTVGVVITAVLFGSIIEAMTDLIAEMEGGFPDIVGGTGVSALLSMLAGLTGVLAAAFAVQATVSMRADEASGILEPQLAGALSRTRWALQRLLIPTMWSAVLLLAGGAIFGSVYGSTVGDSSQALTMAGAALAYWPAVMLLVGIAVALFGWLPRLAIPLSWGVVVATYFAMMLGDVLGLPAWLLDALPFSAVPYLPLESMNWTPLVLMAAAAALLIVSGMGRFTRRDIRLG